MSTLVKKKKRYKDCKVLVASMMGEYLSASFTAIRMPITI